MFCCIGIGFLALGQQMLLQTSPMGSSSGLDTAISAPLIVVGRVLPAKAALRTVGTGRDQVTVFKVRVERVLKGKASGIVSVMQPFGDMPFVELGTLYLGTRYDLEAPLESDHRYILCLKPEGKWYGVLGGKTGQHRFVGTKYLPALNPVGQLWSPFPELIGRDAELVVERINARLVEMKAREQFSPP